MAATTITLPSAGGMVTLNPVAIYEAAKTAFLAEYADDPTVEAKILRNGDLAEREYSQTLKHLIPEACARVSKQEIEHSMVNVARAALCNVAIGHKGRRK